MYKYLLPIFITCSIGSYAQQVSIQPYAGAGISGSIGQSGLFRSNIFKTIVIPSIGINAGISFNRLYIGTGIAWLTTGYKAQGLVFEHMINPATGMPTDKVDIILTHTHLMVPFTAGFTIVKKEKVSITPRAGVALSYNPTSQSTWRYYSDGHEDKTKLNGPGNPYARVSLFGHASLMCAYHINNDIAITLEPVYFITINPMLLSAGGNQRTYAATGNVGVMFKL